MCCFFNLYQDVKKIIKSFNITYCSVKNGLGILHTVSRPISISPKMAHTMDRQSILSQYSVTFSVLHGGKSSAGRRKD